MQQKPWLTIIIVLITCITSAFAEYNLPIKIMLALKIESSLLENFWTLFTYALVHGGAVHLILNMMALYSLGQGIEFFKGRIYFLGIYLVSVLSAGLITVWVYSLIDSPARILVGASGGIFGLFGAIAYLILTKKGVPGSASDLRKNLFLNLIISFLPGISLTAHVAGFATGFLISFLFEKQKTLVN